MYVKKKKKGRRTRRKRRKAAGGPGEQADRLLTQRPGEGEESVGGGEREREPDGVGEGPLDPRGAARHQAAHHARHHREGDDDLRHAHTQIYTHRRDYKHLATNIRTPTRRAVQ